MNEKDLDRLKKCLNEIYNQPYRPYKLYMGLNQMKAFKEALKREINNKQ